MADRISSLPDDVLSHILSFLPTKYSVGTSILSKRWQFLWTTSISNLDFDFSQRFNPDDGRDTSNEFNLFVDRVLGFCTLSRIHKFRLSCNRLFNPSAIPLWMSEVIRHDPVELDLCVYMLELMPSLSTCASLEVLKLRVSLRGIFGPPASFSFPRLKKLHIEGFPLEGFLHNFLSNSPLLEELFYAGELDPNHGPVIHVSHCALKRLELALNGISCNGDGEIVFNAPHLEHFTMHAEFLPSYVLEVLSPLYEVNLRGMFIDSEEMITDEAFSDCAFDLYEFLRGFAGTVNSLSLQNVAVFALEYAYDDNLPVFDNLTRLDVVIEDCLGWNLLLGFLKSSPNLEVLLLGQGDLRFSEDVVWSELQSIPIRLREVEFMGFRGNENDVKFIKEVLRSAEGLKSLKIFADSMVEEEEVKFAEELLRFPRSSRACQIHFLCF